MVNPVNVQGNDELQSGIRKVSLGEYDAAVEEFNSQRPSPKATPAPDTDAEMAEENISSTQAQPGPSLLPKFIELTSEANDAEQKFASNEQASSLLKLERAEKDEKTLAKLCAGLRPGEFFRVFSSLSRIEDNKGKGPCADYLTIVADFCDHLKKIDTGIFSIPESVINNSKKLLPDNFSQSISR
jgi:hypothetical protein